MKSGHVFKDCTFVFDRRTNIDAEQAIVATGGSRIATIRQNASSSDADLHIEKGTPMEPVTTLLAAQACTVIVPALPGLLALTSEATKGAAQAVGAVAVAGAQRLWSALNQALLRKPSGKDAVDAVKDNPDDQDAIASLRRQIRLLLESDPRLTSEVSAILKDPAIQDLVIQRSNSGDISQESAGGPTRQTAQISDSTVGAVNQRKL